ncbi:MAG: thiolase family protein [Segniliparus sp.]|uniref:thiolase family protein n=1 Tax=Segniliparus sp. TaxID=2804064 RepID=UPI003F36E2E3
MNEAFIYDAVRTPFGRYGGGLSGVRPDDLAARSLEALLARTPDLDPEQIDEVVLGNANGAGEENRNVARMATLLAGLPVTVAGSTVNRLCGSALDAVFAGSRAIAVGDSNIVVAGGVESMSRAPWVLPKTEKAFPVADLSLVSTTLGWRLVNPRMPAEWNVSLGEATEQLRERHNISRQRQDEFASRSHELAEKAWNDGIYQDLVVPVPGTELVRDENIRPDSTVARLGALRTSFRPEGTITAGNASPLSDGAAVVLLGSAVAARALGRDPIARIAGRGAAANEPQFFGAAPIEAAARALERARISWSDVGAVELNEAFAAQSLVCIDGWGIDPAIVNQHGGAIALGHPLGASGARLLGTLAQTLTIKRLRWGVAALCIGVGQALAVVLENPEFA